jgi:acyl-CoA thioesterase-1
MAAFLVGASPQVFAAPDEGEIVIVAYGDSLTAGYQLPPEAAFPAQLEKALKAKGYKVRIVNAGVSGDTAANGLARFDWAMPEKADAAILELGANDALRGIPVAQTKAALSDILDRLKARHMDVLIAGMEAPRNWGEHYADAFRAMYRSLAESSGALLHPFFLKGVLKGTALDPALTLSDGLHPNPQGVARIVEEMLPDIEKLIDRVKARRARAS